jgi:ABC-type uncharacterized transport system substrate-binding protein
VLWSLGAQAHPHVMVGMTSEVIFIDGKIAAIRHHWTFDDMYSAFVTANLGKDGKDPTTQDLQGVAQTNVESLREFDYFTVPKMNGKKAPFGAPKDYSMTFDSADKTATLHFTLPLKQPVKLARTSGIELYDPTYFVSFVFREGDQAFSLKAAPAGCVVTITRPKTDLQTSQNLNESFFNALSAKGDFGAQYANRVLVVCP